MRLYFRQVSLLGCFVAATILQFQDAFAGSNTVNGDQTVTLQSSISAALTTGANPSQLEEERKRYRREVLLGSIPPNCSSKCMGCTPCTAVLIIPPHPRAEGAPPTPHVAYSSVFDEQRNYYTVAWKCKCRNRTFQP